MNFKTRKPEKSRTLFLLSGFMPAAGKLTDQEIWQVSQFLHNADKLSASIQELLRQKE